MNPQPNPTPAAQPEGSARHTAGPWRWSYHPVNNERIALVAGDCDVLLATGDDSHAWADVSSPNAYLLASAPDLFAACETALSSLEDLAKAYPNDATFFEGNGFGSDAIRQIRAALAKAQAKL